MNFIDLILPERIAYYVIVFLSFFVSILIASLIIPRILLIANKKRLYDVPDERKIHTKAIPRLGGVSFFPTILFSLGSTLALRSILHFDGNPLVLADVEPKLLLLVCGLTLLFLIGIADDLIGVRYRKKFLIQVICAAFFPLSGICLNNFYGFLGIYEIPFWVGVPLTMFIVVFITNAINLIDGIDGLASGLSSVSLVILGSLFLYKELWIYSMLAFGTLGVLVPFFYYNVFGNVDKARKIFMGDTGSLTLGYIISFLVIQYSMYTPALTGYTEGAIVIAFSTLIVPLFDVVRVVLVRMRNGKHLFMADKNHIHHKLLAIGFTPKRAMVSLIALALLLSGMTILLVPYVDLTVLVLLDAFVWLTLNLLWSRRRKKILSMSSLITKGKKIVATRI